MSDLKGRWARVAEAGIGAMLRGKPSFIPGIVNKLPAFSLRLMPRRLQAATASFLMTAG